MCRSFVRSFVRSFARSFVLFTLRSALTLHSLFTLQCSAHQVRLFLSVRESELSRRAASRWRYRLCMCSDEILKLLHFVAERPHTSFVDDASLWIDEVYTQTQ
jgi:hypothetical protein